MLLGYTLITGVVAAGVGVLIASIPALMLILTLLGAAYLLWLGASTVVQPSVPSEGVEQESSTAGWIGRGFTVSGMNPKALLLFLALLPQFTSHVGNWSIPLQIAALGAVHMANCAIVYTFVGLGSKLVLRTRPQLAKRVSQLSGCAMITVGLCLGLNQISALLT
jgi:threonine/homoserine/homoserine lactone efflux protein